MIADKVDAFLRLCGVDITPTSNMHRLEMLVGCILGILFVAVWFFVKHMLHPKLAQRMYLWLHLWTAKKVIVNPKDWWDDSWRDQ